MPLLTDALDRDHGHQGMYCAPRAAPGALTVAAANVYVNRFVPSRDMTVKSMAWAVTTAASVNDACDVGIYSGDLTTLLASIGSTTGKLNGTGVKTASLTAPVHLRAGAIYYAAIVAAVGGTAAVLAGTSLGAVAATSLFGTAPPEIEQATLTSGGGPPLAAPLTITAGLDVCALLAVREF